MSSWYDPFGATDSLTGGYSNPADAAMPYLNQVPSTIEPYYNPYINLGKAQIPGLQTQYHQEMRNPGGKENQIGASYQQSPGYNWQLQQALMASNNAAAAGGMAGSPQHEQQNMTVASGLANQDYYNYLNHAMQLYGQGLQGSQGLFNTGYGASTGLANALANNLASQASLEYAGGANKNMTNQAMWGGLLGAGAGLGEAALFA